jgi:LysM domain
MRPLVLRPRSVLVLRDGDSLNLTAERYGTTLTAEGETLSSVASEQNLTLSLLGEFNPELSSWPREEPLPPGTTLLLPVYRSTTPIPAGMQLLVPGYLPSTQLRAGEWIYLPARRSAAVLDEQLMPPPGPGARRRA